MNFWYMLFYVYEREFFFRVYIWTWKSRIGKCCIFLNLFSIIRLFLKVFVLICFLNENVFFIYFICIWNCKIYVLKDMFLRCL